ncbi:MAG: hypothetical protein M1834_009733 [Cirrosporium novae-zelandiae]|nr:MAG: hypothetical protein M1834_009733 [Cirrosporium novae-zelandiae]
MAVDHNLGDMFESISKMKEHEDKPAPFESPSISSSKKAQPTENNDEKAEPTGNNSEAKSTKDHDDEAKPAGGDNGEVNFTEDEYEMQLGRTLQDLKLHRFAKDAWKDFKSTNCHHPDPKWNLEVLFVLSTMAKMGTPGNVAIRIGFHDQDSLDGLKETMNSMKTPSARHYFPYLSKRYGTPLVIHGSLATREDIEDLDYPNGKSVYLTEFPPKSVFFTVREGNIKLTYGHEIEHSWSAQMNAELGSGNHSVGFIIVSASVVLALVRFHEGIERKTLRPNENTEFKIETQSWKKNSDKVFSYKARPADDMLGLACNSNEIVMLVKDKSACHIHANAIIYGQGKP